MPDDTHNGQHDAHDDADAALSPELELTCTDNDNSRNDNQAESVTASDPEIAFSHAIRRPIHWIYPVPFLYFAWLPLYVLVMAHHHWMVGLLTVLLLLLYLLILWRFSTGWRVPLDPAAKQQTMGVLSFLLPSTSTARTFVYLLFFLIPLGGIAGAILHTLLRDPARLPSVLELLALLNIHYLLVLSGAYLVSAGFLNTQGNDLHCGQCGYNLGRHPLRLCPECGQAWSEKSPLTLGRVVRNPRKITVGLSLLTIGCLAILPLIRLPNTISLRLPTSVLLSRAGNISASVDAPSNTLWDELISRPLTPAEEDRLTDAMLRHATNKRIWSDSSAIYQWLEDRFLSEQMTDAQLERFETAIFGTRSGRHRRIFATSYIGSDDDHSYSIQKWTAGLSGPFPTLAYEVFVLSLHINGARIETSTEPYMYYGSTVGLAVLDREALPDTSRITIEADIVMLLLPDTASVPKQIDIDDDGNPILPDDTLLHRRVTLTRTVDNPAR